MDWKAAKQISHVEHLALAEEFRAIERALHALRAKAGTALPKNHKIARQLRAVEQRLVAVKSSFDDHYHSVTTEEEFRQHGHVYYGTRRFI
jgi:hypothetical protein